MENDVIYNEDCLLTLKRIPDNSVDLIVTSPPYNKGWWSVNRTPHPYDDFHTKVRRIEYGECDDKMEPAEYEKWQREIIEECLRVLKPTGSFFYNHCDIHRDCLTVHPKYVWDYPVKQLIIWDKGSTPRLDKTYFFPVTEHLFWIKKTPEARPYFNRKAVIYDKNVWRITPDRRNSHPAPFPIELPENCVLACTKEGDVVYDPFMGSGTTALAAKKHNRHYIGSELNAEFITQAEERLREWK